MSRHKDKAEVNRDLDRALEQTFPASDPISVSEPEDEPVRPVGRRPPRIDKALVDELARRVGRKH